MDLFTINAEIARREKQFTLKNWYPDDTKVINGFKYYARKLYPKSLEFWEAGKKYKYRMLCGGNQTSKTSTASYEVACHVTGIYPKDWNGKKVKGPNNWWIAGETNRDVKEIMQDRFIGPVGERGTGLIPHMCLDLDSMTETDKADTFVQTVRVQHFNENGEFDGMSTMTFKSYEAGRKSFQGLPRNIFLDEEPPLEILSECFARTTSNDDLMLILTFTPLQGWSRLLANWFPEGWPGTSGPIYVGGKNSSKYLVIQTVDDVPHISKEKKEEMFENYHPHVREARLKGIPSLGSGAIYPIPRTDWVINDVTIPPHYKKLFGLDVGYNWTACVWLAINPDDGVMYVYSEHKMSETDPVGHAEVIRTRGLWIPGAIDSASNGRGQDGGESLINQYRTLGLNVTNANKSVEAGIYAVWSALKLGQLKVFASCQKTILELESYHRDEKGKIVKFNDHLCDALRYAVMTRELAKTQLPPNANPARIDPRYVNQFKNK
jgi:phage terminase large subunit-like protein